MRLASWSSDAKLSYRRRKRFRLNLGDILGRRHAGFEPVSTEDTDELDPLYRTLVEGGCTTVRDVGGATFRMKALVDEGVILGPRLKVSICMLSTTGGHADFRGPDRCHGTISKLWREGPGRPSSIVDGLTGLVRMPPSSRSGASRITSSRP